MNIRTILDQKAQQFGEKPAIIFQEKSITFSQMREHVLTIANALDQLGIQKGDKVAIFLPNFPEYIFSYLAIFSIGAVAVPLDFMLTQQEVTQFLTHSDAKILIAKSKKGIEFSALKQNCSSLEKFIIWGQEGSSGIDGLEPSDCVTWNQVLASNADYPVQDISDEDHSSIFYTSGSTGHPKGVLLNYGHFDNPVECIEYFLHPTSEDSYLCAGVPFSHLGGLDYMLFMLFFGSTLILMDRFHPFEALKNIQQYKPTIFCIVPAMFVAILSLKECEKFDLTSLRYPVVFGAPSAPELLKKFHRLCPNASLRNGWGMTETAAPNSYSPDDPEKINSIGPFWKGMEVKIVDDNGQELGEGARGELWVRGKAVMVGYYKEAALTKEVTTDDGWFRTGDIVERDAQGLYYIVGRKKDMIKVGGEIVFASEVEAVLYRNPDIQEAAVLGVGDDLRGEVPKAFVVLKEGSQIAEQEIKSFLKQQLASFKIPQQYEFRNELPKNRTGKIDKEILKKA